MDSNSLLAIFMYTLQIFHISLFLIVCLMTISLLWFLKRVLKAQPTDSVIRFILTPAYQGFWILLLFFFLFWLAILGATWVDFPLPVFVLIDLPILFGAFILLSIPYRGLDFISRYNQDHGKGKYSWSYYITAYRLAGRVVIIGLYILIVLETTGFDIKTLLVAGGIGGLIAGMALRELLSDFFSGISLQATPTLNPGDSIRFADKNIEGVIRGFGFRMTSLMTFERRPLLLPNSMITGSVIEHLSMIKSRRIQLTIGVRYEDYAAIESIVAELRTELLQQPTIVDHEASLICFSEFGAYSLNILIRVYTHLTSYQAYCLEKEKILHQIASIVKRNGADFAFPTSEVHLRSAPPLPESS